MLEQLKEKYYQLCHAMQSGVAAWMNYDPQETALKHLRVGVNSAMVEHGALAGLLLEKGIITEQEYYQALVTGMEREVASYAKRLHERFGVNLTLM